MRETRLYGSEGGEAKAFPTPILRKVRGIGIKISLFTSILFGDKEKNRPFYLRSAIMHYSPIRL